MTHLYPGNAAGEILDSEGKVVGRIVPVEPTGVMIYAAQLPSRPVETYKAMLSAAPTDWTQHAVRVPERMEGADDAYGQQRARADGFNAALDAALDAIMGAK